MSSMSNDIRVIKFKNCRCSFSNQPHLRIRRKRVQIAKGNAVAISYTWGEFNPRPVTIGHDRKMRQIIMNLGEEWPVEDVVTTLTRIYVEHSRRRGCWIDQLCIPQTDAVERRRAVMQIPDIFRTFRTVIMMCGKPCKCFTMLAAFCLAWQNSIDPERNKPNPDLRDVAMDIWQRHRRRCADLYGMSSYFDRLWTRQEFVYSSEISIAWSSGIAALCRSLEQVELPGDFSRYTENLMRRFPGDKQNVLSYRGERFFMLCKDTAMLHARYSQTNSMDPARIRNVVLFLLGNQAMRGPPNFVRGPLFDFWGDLQSLGEGQDLRFATKEIDYVAAVWVSCPGYKLPNSYKFWHVSYLLEDAVKQMEQNFGCTLATTFPSEWSSTSPVDAYNRWRPTTYLGELHAFNTNTVYGPIAEQGMPKILEDGSLHIELRLADLLGLGTSALGSGAQMYPKLYGPSNIILMMQDLKHIRKHWSTTWKFDARARAKEMLFSQTLLDTFTNGPGPVALDKEILMRDIFKGIQILAGEKEGPHDWPEEKIKEWAKSVHASFDCQAFLFGLVCTALGLDIRLCRVRGLHVVRTVTAPRLLGLQKGSTNHRADHRRKTILMSRIRNYDNIDKVEKEYCHLRDIEINHLKESSKKYITHIIWVPTCDPAADRRVQGHTRLMFE